MTVNTKQQKAQVQPETKKKRNVPRTTVVIDDKRACEICNKYGKGRDIKCKVVESDKSYAMQTHDFVVGSVAKKYNKNDDSFADLLGVHIQVRNVSPKTKKR